GRGGEQVADMSKRCINDDLVETVFSSDSCSFSTNCEAEPYPKDVITCSECEAEPELCLENFDTTGPTSAPTATPTRNPVQPTITATLPPTLSPSTDLPLPLEAIVAIGCGMAIMLASILLTLLQGRARPAEVVEELHTAAMVSPELGQLVE